MKRLKVILLILFIASYAFADFVEMSFESQQVTIEEAPSHFNEWFGTGDSEFRLFFDETDEIGMRDMDYQQYINGVMVENCALYVHSRNGFVTLINGDVMSIQSKPTQSSKISVREARKKAKVSDEQKAERTFIHETRIDGDAFYEVYKITTDTALIYVDVITGETRRTLPLIHGTTSCHVTTKYNGAQSISCEIVDGEYRLRNNDKNIRTCYANMGNYDSYPAERYGYTNTSTNWDNYYLTSVTISSVNNFWWDVLGEDVYPDLYIRIKDASGNYLFTSDYKQDCGQYGRTGFPITFYISKLIRVPAGGGLTIEIYDEDLTLDTKGTSVTLSNNALGTYTWGSSSSNTQGSFEITKSHPAFDVQWGLEKAYEFYNNLFGLAGFDGQSTLLRAFLHNSGGPDYIKPEYDYAKWLTIFGTKTGYYNNAYASGDPADPSTARLFFGIGNEIGNSEVGLNTIVHEFTHLVTRYRSKGDLAYQGESGAINEGYSDAMAITNDVYMYGTTDWLYDKEADMKINGVQYSYIRNLKNPKEGGPEGPKPDTYGKSDYWFDPSNTSKENDYGGVHMNNSIFTHWYYILCEGKTGVNDNQQSYSVSPIGMSKSLSIIWRMHRTYLPPQSTFIEARKWAIQSAKDLYPSDENIVKAVTDAWYAVGVGNKYIASDDLITIKAQMPSDWGTTISAWAWEDGSEGHWATVVKDGEWYTYTTTANPLNIVFVNGSNWNGDNNQSVDISITESTCILLTDNDSGKRNYSTVDCEPEPHDVVHLPYYEPFTSDIGKFNIVDINLGGLNYVWQWVSAIYGMKASAYVGGKNNVTESWLVSPPISLKNTAKATLAFEHAVNKGSTSNLKVLITTDPSGETWDNLVIPNWPVGTSWTFVPTSVSLNQYAGKIVQLAFVYASTSSDCPTWEIKNLSVTGSDVVTYLPSSQEDTNHATKIIKDGQLLIHRDGKTYDLQGQEVR